MFSIFLEPFKAHHSKFLSLSNCFISSLARFKYFYPISFSFILILWTARTAKFTTQQIMIIRKLGEKETYKYFQILEAGTIIQVEMKEKQ